MVKIMETIGGRGAAGPSFDQPFLKVEWKVPVKANAESKLVYKIRYKKW